MRHIEHAQAGQKEKLTQLTAPVSGTVQQLAVHSVPGVVISATVTAEVTMTNQDIGFVNAGQAAEIKLEIFSYTKYGTIKATVDVVTAEVKTGKRRVIEYFLSPVQRAGSESLRER